jgi:hypothetical protein
VSHFLGPLWDVLLSTRIARPNLKHITHTDRSNALLGFKQGPRARTSASIDNYCSFKGRKFFSSHLVSLLDLLDFFPVIILRRSSKIRYDVYSFNDLDKGSLTKAGQAIQ